MKLKNIFLFRLYQTDKALFVFLFLYMAGLAYGWRLDREQFPFLLYGMYSLKEKPKDSYNTYTIEINNNEIKSYDLLNPKKETVFTTTSHFSELIESEANTTNKQSFYKWLLRYTDKKDSTHNSIKIYRIECQYYISGKAAIKDRKVIGKHYE